MGVDAVGRSDLREEQPSLDLTMCRNYHYKVKQSSIF